MKTFLPSNTRKSLFALSDMLPGTCTALRGHNNGCMHTPNKSWLFQSFPYMNTFIIQVSSLISTTVTTVTHWNLLWSETKWHEQYRSSYSIFPSNNLESTFKRRNIKILHNNILLENKELKFCIDFLSKCSAADMKEQYLSILSVLQRLNINVLITINTGMMTCNFSCIFIFYQCHIIFWYWNIELEFKILCDILSPSSLFCWEMLNPL